MMFKFTELPPEILHQIIGHLETARSLCNLSQSCKKIYALALGGGHRSFVQSNFPSFRVSVSGSDDEEVRWKDATHALTTLSRNFDRKALLAQDVGPAAIAPRRPGQRDSRQTMGFTPVIDSHDDWQGGGWCSRKQKVTWGAGARLIFGSRDLEKPSTVNGGSVGSLRKQAAWEVYHQHGTIDGRDDVTSVKLMPSADDIQEIIIGRANGKLTKVSFDRSQRSFSRVADFETWAQPIRSTAMSSEGLLAACLSDSTLALYESQRPDSLLPPSTIIDLDLKTNSGMTWATYFLRPDRLAIGLGPSCAPIKVIELDRGGESDVAKGGRDISIDIRRANESRLGTTAVYSLESLSASSLASQSAGNIFLSGGYDGMTRLHDLRCANSVTATFEDPVDFSAIYSLISFGHERFIAGGASNSLIKVFDLRMPGSRRYYAMSLHRGSEEDLNVPVPSRYHETGHDVAHKSLGWNVFLGRGVRRGRRGRSDVDSPVYSLSKPSELSPTFFAGIENRVLQIDLISMMDRYPDACQDSIPDLRRGPWRPENICNLPMYEHPHGNESIRLRTQRQIGNYQGSISGWDERWVVTTESRPRFP